MKLQIPFWGEELTVSLPKHNIGEIIYPNSVEIRPEKEVLFEAFNNPIDTVNFDDFIKDDEPILIIINDATRPTPNARIIELIWNKIKNKDIKFLIATGGHREPSNDEYLELFGDHYLELKKNIFSHDSKKKEENIFIGKTENGTEVYFDKMVMNTLFLQEAINEGVKLDEESEKYLKRLT